MTSAPESAPPVSAPTTAHGHMLPPLSLYVHIPWCVRKCPYCDFNSHALSPHGESRELPERAYVDALLRDLDAEVALIQPQRELVSIFIGGGTPSLFSPGAIARLIDGVTARIPLAQQAEITLEANPGTVDEAHFHGFRGAGVNRLSIGVQSFDPDMLHRLGRIHDPAQAAAAIAIAQATGFDRINVDLMHGLPTQTAAGAVRDLQAALATGVTHVSWYQLTIEANTAFHAAPPRLPDEDTLAHIEAAGMDALHTAGLQRYEVSAWSARDAASVHNLNYWQFGDYIGIGAGAHAKLSCVVDDALAITRYQKTRKPDDYLANQQRRQTHSLDAPTRAFEFMLNVLRLRDGVPHALFQAHTGLPIERIAGPLARLQARGLLRTDRLATTPLGYRFLDTVVAEFLPEDLAQA